jgi:hypothetical protein
MSQHIVELHARIDGGPERKFVGRFAWTLHQLVRAGEVRLPGTEHLFTANPRGEVIIYPCPLDNGSWAVEHVSQTGEHLAFLGAYFSYYEAESAARHWAQEVGAAFGGGLAP